MSSPRILLLARADGSRVTTPLNTAALSALDPFGDARQLAWLGDDGVSAGLVQFSGDAAIEDFPHSETLVVHAGHVVLHTADQHVDLKVGDSAVIGRGTRLSVQASAGSRWAFCAVDLADAPAARLDVARPARPAQPLCRTGTANPDRPSPTVPGA